MEAGGVVEAVVGVPTAFTGRAQLPAGDDLVGEWPLTIVPGQVFRATWSRPADSVGAAVLRLVDSNDAIVAQTGP